MWMQSVLRNDENRIRHYWFPAIVLISFIPRWLSDCGGAAMQRYGSGKQVSATVISHSHWCWQHCQLHLCFPDGLHMYNLGSSWQGHLGEQTWKFRKRILPLMQRPAGTIMLPSWKHVVYSCALFLWCLSGELMIIVTPTLEGSRGLLMSCIRLQSAIIPHEALISCPFVFVFVRATVWRGGAQSAAVLVHLMAGPEDSRQGSASAGAGTGSGEGQRGSTALLRPNHCALQV